MCDVVGHVYYVQELLRLFSSNRISGLVPFLKICRYKLRPMLFWGQYFYKQIWQQRSRFPPRSTRYSTCLISLDWSMGVYCDNTISWQIRWSINITINLKIQNVERNSRSNSRKLINDAKNHEKNTVTLSYPPPTPPHSFLPLALLGAERRY